jgi:hypothetical protein
VTKLLSVGQGHADLASGRVVERPHVVYNEATRKYVMVCCPNSGGGVKGKEGEWGCGRGCEEG